MHEVAQDVPLMAMRITNARVKPTFTISLFDQIVGANARTVHNGLRDAPRVSRAARVSSTMGQIISQSHGRAGSARR
jgi:hypothetical protein